VFRSNEWAPARLMGNAFYSNFPTSLHATVPLPSLSLFVILCTSSGVDMLKQHTSYWSGRQRAQFSGYPWGKGKIIPVL
jgi:hypothetical protein